MILVCALAFVLGLIFGSFLNVCAYRIPRGESVVYPPSHCPKCKEPIRWHDNVPVLSYLLLRGRCRSCKEPIPVKYPLVELLTGALTAATVCKFGLSFNSLYYLILIYYLIVVGLIDLETMEVPVKPSYFATLAGILLSPFVKGHTFYDAVMGASFGAGVILFIIETYLVFKGKEGMGYGDANIAAVMGAFLGWKKFLVALFSASFLGAAVGIALMLFSKKGKEHPLPFGPFLGAGALIALFLGDKVLRLYGVG
jgi:leader peptidase (prepilin peptidase)/N-methyltransferase